MTDEGFGLAVHPERLTIRAELPAIKLSIVTTLFNSSPYVEEFCKRICAEAEKITSEFEVILVDDGSPDDSLNVALQQLSSNSRLKVIELSRNFGHHKAMMTGLEHATGDTVFLIDVDLEEPPELLGEFYQKLVDEKWDVVYGCQEQRKGGWFERFSGALAWFLIDTMLPIKVPRNHSTVRLMTRRYVDGLVRHKEQKTAIGGLWVITGFRQTGMKFEKLSRPGSSYRFSSRMLMLMDSITSFSERPLYFVFFLGLGIFCFSTAVAALLLVVWTTGKVLPGWISVMASVWILGGLAILCIGIVGLYISRIFVETKMRPYTLVREIHGSRVPEVTRGR